jgi:hypothetical protein
MLMKILSKGELERPANLSIRVDYCYNDLRKGHLPHLQNTDEFESLIPIISPLKKHDCFPAIYLHNTKYIRTYKYLYI